MSNRTKHFLAIHPTTGERFLRSSNSKTYRWCVVIPERREFDRDGREVFWQGRFETWSTLASPRVPASALVIAAREIVDPVELAENAVARAQLNVAERERELAAELARQAGDTERASEQVRYLADLRARLATAREASATAQGRLVRARDKRAPISLDELGKARDAYMRELDADDAPEVDPFNGARS